MQHKTLSLLLFCLLLSPLLALSSQYDRKAAQAQAEKGIALNNNSEEEISFYQKALEIDPTYALAYYNIANIYFDRQEYKKAIPLYEKAVSYLKNDYDLQFNLALAHFKNRDSVAALLILNEIVRKAPGDLESLFFQSKIFAATESTTNLNAARKNMMRILSAHTKADLRMRSQRLLDRIEKKLGLK
ncbi:MAG: hypothetical protein CVV50_02125 [Spirochaetae bacterium HGW-Spirochaetae-6]|nr:MAG: hypothetical protein CVV50_02125 [Spirochaetae bacterium HGW-Spirochaetae-6]